MNQTPAMRCRFTIMLILFAWVGLTVCQADDLRPGQWLFPDTVRQLRIHNPDGAVEIRAWEQPQILVKGIAVDSRTDLEAVGHTQPSPDRLLVWIRPGLPAGGSIRLEVCVPADVQVTVRTGSGAVHLLGVAGGVVVETDSGAITCRLPAGLDADVAVRSLEGAVDVRLPLELFGTGDTHALDGRIGRGGTPVILRSRSGGILLAGEGEALAETPRRPLPAGAAAADPTSADKPEHGPGPGGEGRPAGGFRLRVDSLLVNLNVRVTDGAGTSIGGLNKEDFRVYENDAQQEVVHFHPQTAPLTLFLLLDLSGSTEKKMDIIKRAAIRFVESLDPADRVAIAAFTSRFMRVCDFSTNRPALRNRVKGIKNKGGGTAFYDALWYSLDELDEQESGRKVLVVLSDGVDNVLQQPDDYTTKHEFQAVLERAASGQVTIFPIYLDTEYEQVVVKRNISSLAYKTARQQIDQLADGTGGTLFRADRVEDLEGVYQRVVVELRTLYSLSYYAPAKSGTGRQWRAVRVEVDRSGASARTRPGYFVDNK
jgi:Ca-activated chloride channel family protein